MRPTYETEEDRSRERAVADILAEKWNCTFNKNPAFYPIDFSLTRNSKRVVAFCEIKCWKSDPKKDFVILSLHKWIDGLQIVKATNIRCLVVFSFPSGRILYRDINDDKLNVIFSGRTDRGDPDDLEPCVVIPLNMMMDCA